MTTINETISDLYEAGTTERDDLIIAVFEANPTFGLAKSTKAVREWMKANDLVTARRGIKAEYYDWLLEAEADAPRSAAEVEAWIKSQDWGNGERHKSAHVATAELVAKAFEKGLNS